MLQPNDDLEGKVRTHASVVTSVRIPDTVSVNLHLIILTALQVAMYGMSSTLPDRTLVGDFTKCYLDAHYYTPKEPEKVVNGCLNTA